VAVNEKGAVLLNVATGQTLELPVDTVVLAMGVAPRRDTAQPFIEAFDNVILIGDNVKGGRIAEAIHDGFTRAFVF